MTTCSICGKNKPDTDFNKRNDELSRTGLQSYCKECQREKHRNEYRDDKATAIDRSRVNKQLLRQTNPSLSWARSSIHGHRKKGHVVLITASELVEMSDAMDSCPLCGCEFVWDSRPGQSSARSLDRKYNGKRITKENAWIICRKCNTIKNDLPLPEFVEYCRNIVQKYG